MQFESDSELKRFSKVEPLLMVITRALEEWIKQYKCELELISFDEHNAFVVPTKNIDMFLPCQVINQAFQRKDKEVTCYVHHPKRNIVHIKAAKLEQLKFVN